MNMDKLFKDIGGWHKKGEYRKIVDAIEALPKNELDYRLISLLARAYENLAQIEDMYLLKKAISLLESVRSEGSSDPYWYFRMGYALFYLNEQKKAKPYFEEALKLTKDTQLRSSPWKHVKSFIAYCDEAAIYKKSLKLYTKNQSDCLKEHIQKYFGPVSRVLHEVISADIKVDICVIEPSKSRNYYTLITMGMGAHRMNVPQDMQQEKSDRAELIWILPPYWHPEDTAEKFYWPLRWMKIIARLTISKNSWIGWGHSVSNEGDVPFAPDTHFSSIMLTSVVKYDHAANRCRLPDGSVVNFYNLLALYPQELEYKCQYDAESLLLLFRLEKIALAPLDSGRPDVSKGHLKNFCRKAKDMHLVLKNWYGPDRCVVSDRITVDGRKVGYCCREAPLGDWDSGWRFMAGDETPEYLNDPDNGDVYHLNTVCNYDSDVIFLLNAPVGSAFMRNERGFFTPCEDAPSPQDIILVN